MKLLFVRQDDCARGAVDITRNFPLQVVPLQFVNLLGAIKWLMWRRPGAGRRHRLTATKLTLVVCTLLTIRKIFR